MKKKLAVWLLLCLMMCGILPVTAQAAWKTTAQGKMYTTSKAPGYYTGWHTIKGKKYYFSNKGIMQTGWKKLSKKYYYFGSDGKMRTGWQTIKKKFITLVMTALREPAGRPLNPERLHGNIISTAME